MYTLNMEIYLYISDNIKIIFHGIINFQWKIYGKICIKFLL